MKSDAEAKRTPLDYFREVLHNPKDLITVPNLLVYFRIILSILFLVFYIKGVKVSYETGEWSWGVDFSTDAIGQRKYLQVEGYLACCAILTCGFTDFLDGYIARKFHQQTEWGVLMDPIADKLLQLCIVIGVAVRWGANPVTWVLLAVLLGKEIFMLLCNLALYLSKGIHFHQAYWYGKASTMILYLTMGIMLFFVGAVGKDSINVMITVLCCICSIALLFAWVMYGIKYIDMFRHPEKYRKPAENEQN